MRTACKLHSVLGGIRQEIRQGMLETGARLPTRSVLAQRFQASDTTVQAAIRILVADGTVITRKRGGSFVAAQPPERCRFALVTAEHARQAEPARQADQRPTYFLDCMASSVAQIAKLRPGWRMDHWQTGDPRLAESVRNGALAGILYFGAPSLAPAVAGTGIPLATFIMPEQPAWAEVNVILSNWALLESSLRSHLARGRRRIAVLDNGGLLSTKTAPQPLAHTVRHIVEAVRLAGGTCKPSWIQSLDPTNPVTAYQISMLLLDRAAKDRPEGLVLLDDHLLPPVLTAIRDLGLRIPADLSVSVQAHHLPIGTPDGCLRLGFDVATFMAEIVDLLAGFHQGKRAPYRYQMRIAELGGEKLGGEKLRRPPVTPRPRTSRIKIKPK